MDIELEKRRETITKQLEWQKNYHAKKVAIAEKALEMVKEADETLLTILENVK